MRENRILFLLIAVTALAACAGLFAGPPAFAAGACQGDIAQFCPGAKGKQAMECLKEHRQQLTPPCKEHVVQVLEAAVEAHQDCEGDIFMFCQGVQPGGGRIMNCLKAHRAELSPLCKEGLGNLLMSK